MDRQPAASFEDLVVWQKAHQFVLAVYRQTDNFPADERFGLTQQFRRAAVSIPANIAEGFRKRGIKDKVRFMNIAQGSLEECRYYILLAKDLDYIPVDELKQAIEATSRLLNAYTRKLNTQT